MRPLAIALASSLGGACAVAWPAGAVATTLHVTNCQDSGAGSLRDAVAGVSDGGTVIVDGNLPCSTITLTSGAINITKGTLYLTGPGAGANAVAISGGGQHGVLRHSGAGKLAIEGLTIRDGKYQSATSPRGGCVYSASNVTLVNSTIVGCTVTGTDSAVARGGGVYAHGTVGMRNSTITGNTAFGASADAEGGGIFVHGTLVAMHSIFSNNEASTAGFSFSMGGGLWTQGDAYLLGSLVSANKAQLAAAIGSETALGGSFLAIVNSTISENIASFRAGGVYTRVPLTLSNSTVAFNQAPDGGAVYAVAVPMKLQSSIIADNVTNGAQGDLDGALSPPLSGYNNLITSSTIGVPVGTITACPKLGPLADNGGRVMLTHALLSTSPAIDMGYNPLVLQTDQRGPGFAREFGVKADIGAFERQGGPDDRIFVGGFEPICDH